MPKNEALAKGCFFPLAELYYKHAVEKGNTARLGLKRNGNHALPHFHTWSKRGIQPVWD